MPYIQGDAKKRELLKCVVAAMYNWQHCGTGTLSYRQPRHLVIMDQWNGQQRAFAIKMFYNFVFFKSSLFFMSSCTWYYYHLKEECLQFHSDLKCIRCAPHVWHGRCPGDTPIPAKPSQACLVWRSPLRCWCALAILVVSLEVVGRKHGSNIMYFCSVFVKIWFCKILR